MDDSLLYKRLRLTDSLFAHSSELHGIGHTYRVMLHAYRLSEVVRHTDLQAASVAAAFIHDMERVHDGYCTEHGRWAAERVLPRFSKFFEKHGIDRMLQEHISIAVTIHSMDEDLNHDHPAYTIASILKDADALDRIRLGHDNLDPAFLRFPESIKQIDFAHRFYFSFDNTKFYNFAEVLEFAELINQNKSPW